MSESNNDSEQGPDISIVIEKTAEFISKNGVEYEKMILDSYPRYTFFRSFDLNHSFYQQKLMEYRNGAHNDAATDSSDDNVEMIHPPPGGITTRIQGTARSVAKKGLEAEKRIMQSEAKNPRYNFLRRSDPYHAFYKHKLAEYRSQNPHLEEDDDAIDTDDEADAAARLTISQSQYIVLPNHLLFCIPPGMTLQEFKIIKLTAQFVGWYGGAFWLGLKKRAIPLFEFLDPTCKWYSCFSKLALEYSKVLMRPTDMKQELVDSAAYTATILDAFLLRLQWGPLQHQEWLEGGKRAMIDWHDSVTKDFANKDQHPELPPPQKQSPPPLEEPDPKRQKLDESALAQHPGSSTVRVSVPKR